MLSTAMLGNGSQSSTLTGQNIILVGLFIQIISFGIFIGVALLFHRRMHSSPTPISMQLGMPWQKHVYVLYFVSLLIMIRSVVRVIEYIQGFEGYILSHEIFLYIFDGTLMFTAVAVFNIVHPSELLPGRLMLHERMVSLEQL